MKTSLCNDGDLAGEPARAPSICMPVFTQAGWPLPLPNSLSPLFQLINPRPQTFTPHTMFSAGKRKSKSKCTLGKEQETYTKMAITGHFNCTCGFSFCSKCMQWMWPDYLNSMILAIITMRGSVCKIAPDCNLWKLRDGMFHGAQHTKGTKRCTGMCHVPEEQEMTKELNSLCDELMDWLLLVFLVAILKLRCKRIRDIV